MQSLLDAESSLTDRYQTTVPDAVRRALRLGKRDKIRYSIGLDGVVVLTRAVQDADDDPALAAFLVFLARDMAANPQRLKAVDAGLAERIAVLVDGASGDMNAALSAADE